MKSYTDIEQSHKLAEILSYETADMYYFLDPTPAGNIYHIVTSQIDFGVKTREPEYNKGDIPCWSLASLFGVLPTIDDEFEPQLHRSLDKYRCTYEGEEDSSGLWRVANNPVDACYEMIIKLHELNLL